jgi:hypothetical protein
MYRKGAAVAVSNVVAGASKTLLMALASCPLPLFFSAAIAFKIFLGFFGLLPN